MNDLVWRVLYTKDLQEDDYKSISLLKMQHWKYDLDSQIKWMKINYSNMDIHLLGLGSDGKIMSYLSMTDVKMRYNNESVNPLGIGCVCVDKEHFHNGYGKMTMKKVNQILVENGKTGLLLCKSSLVSFYKKCMWNEIRAERIIVSGMEYNHKMMVYPTESIKTDYIEVDKNF